MTPRILYARWLGALGSHVLGARAWPGAPAGEDAVSAQIADLYVSATAPHNDRIPQAVWLAGCGAFDLFLRRRADVLPMVRALEEFDHEAPDRAMFDPLTLQGLISIDALVREGIGSGEVRVFIGRDGGTVLLTDLDAEDVVALGAPAPVRAGRPDAWFARTRSAPLDAALFWSRLAGAKPPDEAPAEPSREELDALRRTRRWAVAA